MSEPSKVWYQLCKRITLIAGLLGMIVGIFISTWNADELGWSLLRVSGLGVLFALAGRTLSCRLVSAWLISKIQEAEVQARKEQEMARAKG